MPSRPSRHRFVSRVIADAIEHDLRAEIEEEVREEVEEDFRDRLADFVAGGESDDDLFIGLNPQNERDIDRARDRAEHMLESRMAWIVERRLEIAVAKLADHVGETITERMAERIMDQQERDQPLPALRKRMRRQAHRRIARSRPTLAR